MNILDFFREYSIPLDNIIFYYITTNWLSTTNLYWNYWHIEERRERWQPSNLGNGDGADKGKKRLELNKHK